MPNSADSHSGWPIIVALGLVVGELGVLFGATPVAVGGVVLFGGGAAAIAREAGLARDPWRPLAAIGLVIGALSFGVWSLRVYELSPGAYLMQVATDAIAVRAAVVFAAALVLVAAGLVGTLFESRRADVASPE